MKKLQSELGRMLYGQAVAMKMDVSGCSGEAYDIQSAAAALTQLAGIAASESYERDGDDVQEVAQMMRALCAFIGGEIDDMVAASQMPDGQVAAMMTARLGGKAIGERADVSPADKKDAVAQYGDVKYADETNKKYPIDTEEHIRAAWNYINKQGNADKYSADEVAAIKKRIVAAWKDKIDKAGPPSADEKKSAEFDLHYVKSLRLPHDDQFLMDVVAAKSVGGDEIKGYLALWGDAEAVDVEGEFFTKQTDFWDGVLGLPRPLTYEHGQERKTVDVAVIGNIAEMGDDEIGRWYTAQLDRNHRYRKAIDALISKKALGTSSDTALQYALRERTKSGAVWLKQWPLFAASLTTTPAEPRMLDVGAPFWKAVKLPPGLGDARAEASRDAARTGLRFRAMQAVAEMELQKRLLSVEE